MLRLDWLGLPNVRTTHATEGHEPDFLFFYFLGSTRAKVWLVRRWVLPFENTKGTFQIAKRIYVYYNTRIFLANTNLNVVIDL